MKRTAPLRSTHAVRPRLAVLVLTLALALGIAVSGGPAADAEATNQAPTFFQLPDEPVQSTAAGFTVGASDPDQDAVSLTVADQLPTGIQCSSPDDLPAYVAVLDCQFHQRGRIPSATVAVTVTDSHGASVEATITIRHVRIPGYDDYVVLGDSYASGEGVAPFDRGTAAPASYPADPSSYSCHRSYKSWARLLERRAGKHLDGQFACSGATVASLGTRFKGKPAQLSRLAELTQQGAQPSYVLVTVGGNDVGFADVVAACYVQGRTPGCAAAVARSEAAVAALPALLQTGYRRIAAAAPGAEIIVVGYPQILSTATDPATDARCPWISPANRQRLARLADALDAAISTEAVAPLNGETTRIEYVSTLDALRGHELCSAEPWVNRVDLTPTALATGTYVYSAHPSARGQSAIADVVASVLRGRTPYEPY